MKFTTTAFTGARTGAVTRTTGMRGRVGPKRTEHTLSSMDQSFMMIVLLDYLRFLRLAQHEVSRAAQHFSHRSWSLGRMGLPALALRDDFL